VGQSSEFCRHNPLSCSSASVYCCGLFRYQLSPETFGCSLVCGASKFMIKSNLYYASVSLGRMGPQNSYRFLDSKVNTNNKMQDVPFMNRKKSLPAGGVTAPY
jgi:hypothetical protein